MKETVSFCKEYVTPAIICYQFEVKSTGSHQGVLVDSFDNLYIESHNPTHI
jgi:hypothetical protein